MFTGKMVDCVSEMGEHEPHSYVIDSGKAFSGTGPGLEKIFGLPA